MPRKTLALLHTSATLAPIFQKLCQEKLPGVALFHIADETLIRDMVCSGKLTEQTTDRVQQHIDAAAESGADYILVTCSSIGGTVEAAAKKHSVPILRVDQPMADRAVSMGRRIGVLATAATTLEPTADLIQRRAVAAGKQVEVTVKLCANALAALMNGEVEQHDAIVVAALRELAMQVDVMVLAQASMARVLHGLDAAEFRTPILASPGIAMDYIAQQLQPF